MDSGLATRNGVAVLTARGVAPKYFWTMYNKPEGYNMAAKVFQPVPLALETRAALPTNEAAYQLNRAEQTLRMWAMRNDGPVKCLRVGGRLQWPVVEIKALMGVA